MVFSEWQVGGRRRGRYTGHGIGVDFKVVLRGRIGVSGAVPHLWFGSNLGATVNTIESAGDKRTDINGNY